MFRNFINKRKKKMKIDENTIIRCKSQTEVSKCLDMLKDLGFKTFYEENDYELFVAISLNNLFTNFKAVEVGSKNNFVSFKTFQKLYNKQIKERKPDLVVDKNGKILKVNNNKKMYTIYFFDPYGEFIHNVDRTGKALQDSINYANYYISEEACEKALKRKEIENKLRALAFELNDNKDIDWDDGNFKYSLDYCIGYIKTIATDSWKTIKHQGTIYSYSEDFVNKAIKLIGEEDLKEYIINC